MKPYPLKFNPEFKERVWGGRALESFGLALPEGKIGEGWMIADHPNGTTKVANGDLSGKGLEDIRLTLGREWFGAKGAAAPNGRFPLLLKLLDCNDNLSVQVHPDDHYERLARGELGKTEMWYVLSAEPDAKIIYGLRDGMSRASFEQLIRDGRIMDGLRQVSVKAGDVFYIPAGTVHALMAGVLVVEVQQNSDTTYRLYDYNRPGLDGKPRELHIEDSLNVIHYDNGGALRTGSDVGESNRWIPLVNSPFFITEKAVVNGDWAQSAAADSFTILVVCEGHGELHWPEGCIPFHAGDCFLMPANLETYRLQGHSTLLRSYLP